MAQFSVETGTVKIGEQDRTEIRYSSNFSSNVDGFSNVRSTVTGNNDNISDGNTSKDNVLKYYASNDLGTHYIQRSLGSENGKKYLLTFDYYIPSENTNVDGFELGNAIESIDELEGSVEGNIVGSWTTHRLLYMSRFTAANVRFEMTKVGSGVFTGANDSSDDIIYIKNIVNIEPQEIPEGSKYIEQVSDGITSLPSKHAYGEWKFDLNLIDTINIDFISDVNNRVNTNGYILATNSVNQLGLLNKTNGSAVVLFLTATSYLLNNTWYDLKIQRLASSGVFKEIDTLQTSDLENGTTTAYSTFTSNGSYGFSASAIGNDNYNAGTVKEINIVNTESYLIEFDLNLIEGSLPIVRFRSTLDSTTLSNSQTTIVGRNNIILTAASTNPSVLAFSYLNDSGNFEISNLRISRVYPVGTFAVWIKSPTDSNFLDWTLVDTTGGSGTNPITDNTYTESNFAVLDMDAGDKFRKLSIKRGVQQ